jgi:hypothetical protein
MSTVKMKRRNGRQKEQSHVLRPRRLMYQYQKPAKALGRQLMNPIFFRCFVSIVITAAA